MSEEQIFCFLNNENWAWHLVGLKHERGESLVKRRFLNFIIPSLTSADNKLGWEVLCTVLCLWEKFHINLWIWNSGLVFLWRKWKNNIWIYNLRRILTGVCSKCQCCRMSLCRGVSRIIKNRQVRYRFEIKLPLKHCFKYKLGGGFFCLSFFFFPWLELMTPEAKIQDVRMKFLHFFHFSLNFFPHFSILFNSLSFLCF